jgi:hypothetical protein
VDPAPGDSIDTPLCRRARAVVGFLCTSSRSSAYALVMLLLCKFQRFLRRSFSAMSLDLSKLLLQDSQPPRAEASCRRQAWTAVSSYLRPHVALQIGKVLVAALLLMLGP